MGGEETTLGGNQEQFPETIGSLIRCARDQGSLEHKTALNRLFLLYWRPIYAFVRKHGFSIEDAKDLTQDFMVELLDHGMLQRYDSARGHFRAYLKGALQLFLAEHRRAQSRQKRASSWTIHPFSVKELEDGEFVAELQECGPDEMFDRQVAREVMARCLRMLRRDLEVDGRRIFFDVFAAYDLCPLTQEPPTYRSIAAAMHLEEGTVRKILEHVRKRFDELLVEAAAEHVGSPDELKEELERTRTEWRTHRKLRPDALER